MKEPTIQMARDTHDSFAFNPWTREIVMNENKKEYAHEHNKESRPVGRPTLYSDEMTTKICALMSTGLSLNKIQKMEGMPASATVFEWLIKYPEFSDKYARAVETRIETLMDSLIDIADEPADHSFRTQADPGGVNHRKLQIDTRKWAISKMLPKKYGEKVETTHAGVVEINQITRKIIDTK